MILFIFLVSCYILPSPIYFQSFEIFQIFYSIWYMCLIICVTSSFLILSVTNKYLYGQMASCLLQYRLQFLASRFVHLLSWYIVVVGTYIFCAVMYGP